MTSQAGSDGTLEQIWIYPVKSCRRVALTEAHLSATGLVGDRTWQVVDADGAAVTQRSDKNLALVDVQLLSDGGLTLSLAEALAGSTESVAVPPVTEAPDNTKVQALIGDEVTCADAGDQAADFFSELLQRPARLVGFTRTTKRPSVVFENHEVTFVDAVPITIANTASLADLQARSDNSFSIERFRPNLLFATDTPWVEDTWGHFNVGKAHLQAQVPWGRCEVPQINQDTAERTSQPARVLKDHRWCTKEVARAAFPDKRIFAAIIESNSLFAVGCTVEQQNETTLSIGDTVTVHSTKTPVIPPPSSEPAV